ncbi:hypothetical protein Sta7437_1868 [Stanieria cyanosphaera PCC 7437]|uniref:Uncharacterized protein n=1 Tax=Stanieria cyanosphaera (strain ATCC 29371 / PCC 7437) TaxID=111780 RepID=K9XTN3_STAC7|nr:hypothetical protein [Stanieria cyanosphaera]AFZ35424.1 hypothetical protein Sta7437_1868 [Stanieria cyanosphaera PCC 7437]
MFKQHRITKIIGGSLVAISLGLSPTFLFPSKSIAQEMEQNQNQNQENVTIEDMTGNAEEYVGQQVTVRSTIQEELGDTGFILQNNQLFGGSPVLVFNPLNRSLNRPSEDVPIQVTGTVQQFVIDDLEREYGLTIDRELYTDYENQPAIIADNLALAPTIEQLAENPADYYDQAIAVEGEIGEYLSSNMFALYQDGWLDNLGLLITDVNQDLSKDNNAFEQGKSVVVTGVVRPFDADILRQDSDLGWSAEQIEEFESRYTQRPVIAAEQVYIRSDNK